LKEHFISLIT